MANAIALVGDVHGHHHAMVSKVNALAAQAGVGIDLVVQVGDFEAHRHEDDLATMAAPQKYRTLGDFPDFYNGQAEFPWPVIFVGGNHEPYGWYDQYPEGHELVKNCRYLGRVGGIEHRDIRIVGMSGVYSERLFTSTRPPIGEIKTRSNKDYIGYSDHDVDAALTYDKCDLLVIHDWPGGMLQPEDHAQLPERWDVATLGNEYTELLIEALEPSVVACGHMHFPFQKSMPLRSGDTVEVFCLDELKSSSGGIVLLDDELKKIEVG